MFDQVKRACTAIGSNLAEGRRRIGKDRLHFFRVAEGSAAEVHTQLQMAEAFGDLPPKAARDAIKVCDQLVAICYGLTRDKQRGG